MSSSTTIKNIKSRRTVVKPSDIHLSGSIEANQEIEQEQIRKVAKAMVVRGQSTSETNFARKGSDTSRPGALAMRSMKRRWFIFFGILLITSRKKQMPGKQNPKFYHKHKKKITTLLIT